MCEPGFFGFTAGKARYEVTMTYYWRCRGYGRQHRCGFGQVCVCRMCVGWRRGRCRHSLCVGARRRFYGQHSGSRRGHKRTLLTRMRRLAPYRGPLIAFTAVGVVMAFLAGWLEAGTLLAGVATAAVIAVVLGVGFSLFARVLALGPPSLDGSQSSAADGRTSLPTQSERDRAKDRDGVNTSSDAAHGLRSGDYCFE